MDDNQQERIMAVDNNKDAEIVRFLLEQEQEIEVKLMYYKGFTYNAQEDSFEKVTDQEEMLNDKGIHFASREFRRFLNKNSATANLSEKQVESLIMSFSSSVRRNLLHNLRNFNITSLSTVDEVKNDITDTAFLILTQSIDDKGRNYIHQGRKMTELRQLTETTPNKDKKIW